MKIVIASDIHGSALWTDKLINYYKKSGAEKLVLLGDVLYHGPRNDLPDEYCPKKVVGLLSEISPDIICVRGNCDAEIDGAVLSFPLYESAQIFDGKNCMTLAHGHNIDAENLPSYYDGKILLVGHTHVPCDTVCGKTRVINPGSVSIPKNGSAHGCVFYDGENFKFITL